MGKTYEQYRSEIYQLDYLITNTTDIDQKLLLIDRNIGLNRSYIHALRRPLPVKIVFCVLLSFAFLLGLMIFLPQIIIRTNRADACQRRIDSLMALKRSLLYQKAQQK